MSRIALMLALLSALAAVASDPEPIRLRAGEQRVVDVGDYVRLAIANPDVVAVAASKEGGELTLTGRNAGKTTLLVWQKHGGRVPYLIDVRPGSKPQELSIRAGEEKVLHVDDVTRIAVGDPGIADVKRVSGSELKVLGHGQGRTTLMIWQKDGARLEYEVAVAPGEAQVSLPKLALKIGETKHVEFHNVKRIALGDPEIADVQLGEKLSLDIVGKGEGTTSLLVWHGDDGARVDYEITVTR